jgi:hypothetical protein
MLFEAFLDLKSPFLILTSLETGFCYSTPLLGARLSLVFTLLKYLLFLREALGYFSPASFRLRSSICCFLFSISCKFKKFLLGLSTNGLPYSVVRPVLYFVPVWFAETNSGLIRFEGLIRSKRLL